MRSKRLSQAQFKEHGMEYTIDPICLPVIHFICGHSRKARGTYSPLVLTQLINQCAFCDTCKDARIVVRIEEPAEELSSGTSA